MPNMQEDNETAPRRRSSWLARTLMFSNIAFLGLAIWGVAEFGSMEAVLKAIKGEALFVDASVKSFGAAAPNQKVNVSFLLTNRGDRPLRIIGSKSGCACTVPDRLPCTMGPKERREFHVTVLMPEAPGGLNLSLTLYTNNINQPEIDLTIIGEVIDGAKRKPAG